MGKLLKNLFKTKNENSKRFKLEMAERISGKRLRYVTERHDDVDDIIGRDGCISVREGEVIVFSSGEIVLRTDILDMKAWELLSLDGVVITAPDKEHGGEIRTIIAYYVYYRK